MGSIVTREALEQERDARERRDREFLEDISDMAQIVSPQGQLVFANRAWRDTLGYNEAESLALNFRDVVAHECVGTLEEILGRVANKEAIRGFDTVFVTRSGTQIHVEGTLGPQIENGVVTGARGLFRDVTARKRAEEELIRSVRAKDEFLAGMSHELRTPLNAILGLSEALQEGTYGPLTPKQRESLQTIEHSGLELLEILTGVLDLARIGGDRLALDIQDIDPDEICQQVVRIIRPKATACGVNIHYSNSGEVTTMRGDARRIRQILLNLLKNAVKFTVGGGEAGVSVEAASEETIVFMVWDTGEGFDPCIGDVLAQAFTQGSTGFARKHEGVGLGLSLAVRLAELHGGTIVIESQVGRGSRFTVRLPIHEEAQWRPA